MTHNFYCRKGMYGLPVQAIVDSAIRFLYMSCRCSGGTHNTAAFYVSELVKKLKDVYMKEGYWIAGDVAHVPTPGLLTS